MLAGAHCIQRLEPLAVAEQVLAARHGAPLGDEAVELIQLAGVQPDGQAELAVSRGLALSVELQQVRVPPR